MKIQSTTHQTAEDIDQLKSAFGDKSNMEENASVYNWLLPDGIDTQTVSIHRRCRYTDELRSRSKASSPFNRTVVSEF